MHIPTCKNNVFSSECFLFRKTQKYAFWRNINYKLCDSLLDSVIKNKLANIYNNRDIVRRFHRCRFEFHHAAATYVVHTFCRVRAVRDAALATAMVRPCWLWNGANTHGDGRHKSSALHTCERKYRIL